MQIYKRKASKALRGRREKRLRIGHHLWHGEEPLTLNPSSPAPYDAHQVITDTCMVSAVEGREWPAYVLASERFLGRVMNAVVQGQNCLLQVRLPLQREFLKARSLNIFPFPTESVGATPYLGFSVLPPRARPRAAHNAPHHVYYARSRSHNDKQSGWLA